jgi:hypothetical protein
MAAPFEQAFEEFEHLQEEAAKYTSEAAPQGVMEGGEVRAIHYREEEAIFIKASHDRVTVIFSTIFRDETDRVFGKVFLQVIPSFCRLGRMANISRNSWTPGSEQSRMRLKSSSGTIRRSSCSTSLDYLLEREKSATSPLSCSRAICNDSVGKM